MTTKKATILTLLVVAFCAARAHSSVISAATITVTASSPSGEGPVYTEEIDTSVGDFVQNEDGTQTWVGSTRNEIFGITWDYFYDPDPGVSGNLSITNNTNSTQLFSMSTGVVSSIAAPSGSPMKGASTISVSDSDFSNTSATISSPPGGAIYSGIVDGTTDQTLFPSSLPGSFALTAPGAGVNVSFASFLGSTTTALPVNGFLTLKHEFTLTGGDSATANSTLFVAPEPSGLALLFFGLMGIGMMRSRRG